MNKKKIALFLFFIAFIISGTFAAIYWLNPKNSAKKYDLDYVVKDIPLDSLNENNEELTIQGLVFPKGTYRILSRDKKKNVATIHFVNGDSSDADYIIPIEKKDVKNFKRHEDGDFELTYRDRQYNTTNAYVIAETKDYMMVQMLQPPPGILLKYDFKLSFAELVAIMQIITVLLAVTFYFFETRREKEIARREIYQRLEFEAIDIFQFEIQNFETIKHLLDDSFTVPAANSKDPQERRTWWQAASHLCSILNLFDMAVEFRSKDIMDQTQFLTWVAWFRTITMLRNFKPLWEDLSSNYSPSLKEIMQTGIDLRDHPDGEAELLSYISNLPNLKIDKNVSEQFQKSIGKTKGTQETGSDPAE